MSINQEIYSKVKETLAKGEIAVIGAKASKKSGDVAELKKEIIVPDSKYFNQAVENGFPIIISEKELTTVFEPFFPEERLIVLGGGHIALALVDFAAKTGFSATVCDDRPSFANKIRFPLASEVICESFERVFEKLKIRQSDYVVIITRGHRHDKICMENILSGTEPFYFGMIGSRRRVGALKAELIANGFDGVRVNKTHAPIGLRIGAVTPSEIAASIVAELISCKRLNGGGRTKRAAVNRSDIDMNVLYALAAEIDVPKAIVTVISAKGSVPRGAGAKMIVYADGRILGSIGGGCSEAEVIISARSIIGAKRFCTHKVDLTAEIAEEEGMVCGGVMTVLIEDF
jgi:xanthine dehydrogenase accessory factor